MVVALPPKTEEISNADIIQHPIFRRLQKNKNQSDRITRQIMNKQPITINTDLPALMSPPLPTLMPPAPSGPPASVDISTMRQMPWVDFATILDNTEVHLREQVILDILQNNLPRYSGDVLYYIHHDPENNIFSIKIDETAEEIQDFIGSIMLINAQLKVETLSAKERERLIKKKET